MSLLLTIQLPSLADTYEHEEEAAKLYALDLFKGTSTTAYVPNLEAATDRAQAIVLIGRAMGWDVSTYTTTEFSDVPSYAVGYVQYAKDHGITNGVGNGLYGSYQPVTAMEVYTWYYRALGYKESLGQDAWGNIPMLIEANMITIYQYDDVEDPAQLIRDDIVGLMYTSMFWFRAGATTNLLEDLIGDQKVDGEVAANQGMITFTDLAVTTVTPLTHGKVEIEFNNPVDQVGSSNFSITGAAVLSAKRLEDKNKVELIFSGADTGDQLTITMRNLETYDVRQDTLTYQFTMPKADYLYNAKLEFANGATQLKSDGISSIVLTYSLVDRRGDLVEEEFNCEVAFTTYYGELNTRRIELVGGRAQVILTSELLPVASDAPVSAQVSACDFNELIGEITTATIEMTPDPDEVVNQDEQNVQEIIATSTSSLRMIFKEDVNVDDYLLTSGAIDPTKCTISVRKNSTKGSEGIAVNVKTLAAVAGNAKALDVILDTDAAPTHALQDNKSVWVYFIDNSGDEINISELTTTVEDITKPYIEDVRTFGDDQIRITFSEPVVDSVLTQRATNIANWKIDGYALSSTNLFGQATVTCGEYDLANRVDNRHIITIDLGYEKSLTNSQHYIYCDNFGDWASMSDSNNYIESQSMAFRVTADDTEYTLPVASLTVQSPEQYLLSFNQDVVESATNIVDDIEIQFYSPLTSAWEPIGNMSLYKGTLNIEQDFIVKKIDGQNFLIECDMDWTSYWSSRYQGTNYYNYQYRLFIPKGVFTTTVGNVENNIQYLSMDTGMSTNDTISPMVISVGATVGEVNGSSYDITFSEPIKVSYVANTEGATESIIQGYTAGTENWGNIPTGTVKFIKSDNSSTVSASISSNFVYGQDKTIRVYPVSGSTPVVLSEGTWNVVIQSFSDDVGNTISTVTYPISVSGNGSGGVAGAPEVLYAFADVDTDKKVENLDASDGNGTYDFIYIKFSKPMNTNGLTTNALESSNYRLNGSPLPAGSQVLSNIAGYDDFDSVVDSVTIRMPQNTLGGTNNNHTLYVSENIQSTDGLSIGANSISQTLPYSDVSWNASMAIDIQDEIDVTPFLVLTNNSRDSIMANQFIATNQVRSFVNNYKVAMDMVLDLPNTSYVKQSYRDALNEYLDDIINHDQYENFMGYSYILDINASEFLQLTIDNGPVITNYTERMPEDSGQYRFSVTVQDVGNYGYSCQFDRSTGRVTVNYNRGADNNQTYSQKLIIFDNLLQVSDAVYVDIVDDAGNDSLTLRYD